MEIEFRDLRYTVRGRMPKGKGREIIKGVHGRFSSGKLIAIMGPSGAGKSSLLNAVSGFRSAGVSGELLVNGQPRNESRFQRQSCYITQEDLLQPLLTVKEAMAVAAKLKLPDGVKVHSDDILKQLGLTEHKDTKTDSLSGGQKKRLSIALELVNNPPVFFLDEPTSGLDNVTSVQCVKLLRQLARQGRTIVATIHQPSASLLELFDQVYVLAQGCCIYQGDSTAIVPFLQSVGIPCPRHHNPADFIIEVTENPENIKVLSETMLNGKVFKTAKLEEIKNEPSNSMELKIYYKTDDSASEETQVMLSNEAIQINMPECKIQGRIHGSSSSMSSQMSRSSSSLAWMKVHKSESKCGYATSGLTQFKILLCRMLLQISRNRQGLWIQLMHHIGCALLVGLCFWNMADDGSEMFNHLKLCVGIVIFFAYTQLMVPVLVYPTEVKLVKKEHFNRWYGLTPYYAALTVSKLPVQITLNCLFMTIVYFMVGIPFTTERFIIFCLVGNVISLVSEGMGLAIGSIFSIRNGCAIGPTTIAPFLGLAIYGFDFAHSIPLLMNILMKTSFIRCGVVAMVLTIFGLGRAPLNCPDVYCHFAKPDVLLKYLDIEHSSVWLEIVFLLAIMTVFRALCYIGLKWRFAT